MGNVGDHERLLDDLIESGIFEQSGDGGLRPTESFQAKREQYRLEVAEADDELDEVRSAYVTDDQASQPEVGIDVLGDARAIFQTVESLGRERSLLAALALERIEANASAGEVPDGFVEVEGEEIDGFMQAHPAAVVYFWREDCDPCDEVRETLESLLANGDIPEWVGLGAVYGPDCADLARDRYQVAVAPTTLFCADGRIDSRIIGTSGYDAVRNEIRTIVESADGPS